MYFFWGFFVWKSHPSIHTIPNPLKERTKEKGEWLILKWRGRAWGEQSSVKNVFIRGSVVRYVHLPGQAVDTALLEDATRRGK